jgi:hypothetical protein
MRQRPIQSARQVDKNFGRARLIGQIPSLFVSVSGWKNYTSRIGCFSDTMVKSNSRSGLMEVRHAAAVSSRVHIGSVSNFP